MSVEEQFAALKLDVTHLIYAIDRGYFGDSHIRSSAFVTPLRAYVDPKFQPIKREHAA